MKTLDFTENEVMQTFNTLAFTEGIDQTSTVFPHLKLFYFFHRQQSSGDFLVQNLFAVCQ